MTPPFGRRRLADTDGTLPPEVLREAWAEWRVARHAALRAEVLQCLLELAALAPPSAPLLVMHARVLEAVTAQPAPMGPRAEATESARGHLDWLLATAATLGGLPAAARPAVALVLSHLIGHAIHLPLAFATSPAPSAPPPVPRLAYHWPLDGSLSPPLREAQYGGVPSLVGRSIRVVAARPLERASDDDAPLTDEAVRFAGGGGDASALVDVAGLDEGALSVSAWVRVGAAADDWVSLWSFDGGSSLRCELANSADPQLWSANPTARVSTAYDPHAQTALRDGRWHHVAATYDGPRRTAALYVDGVPLRGTYAGSTGAPGAAPP